MANQNKIILIGKVKETPDIKMSTNGFPVTNFMLLVDRPSAPDRQATQDTIPIVAWRQAAETMQTVQQGQLILVEGRIQTRNYETETGQRKYVTEVDARQIKALSNDTPENTIEPVKSEGHSSLEEKAVDNTENFDFNDPFTENTASNSPNITEEEKTELEESIPF